ncbi:MAG: signal peptidase I [Pseudomonadales bacterium]
MNIDFPLLLVLATAFTGLVWLLDARFLRPRRQAAAEKLPARQQEAALAEPWLVEYSVLFFPVLAIVLVLRSFLYEPFQIPSESMLPTLEAGDFILVNKYHYGLRLPVIGTKILSVNEPKRGEVMVFFPPDNDEYFIKRVAALPGDKIRYQDKTLYINGEEQEQTFVSQYPPVKPQKVLYKEQLGDVEHLIERSPYASPRPKELVVPEGHYFMMGDNRDNSNDSRFWGAVPEDRIVGKAVAIWLHKKPGLRLPELSRVGRIQ